MQFFDPCCILDGVLILYSYPSKISALAWRWTFLHAFLTDASKSSPEKFHVNLDMWLEVWSFPRQLPGVLKTLPLPDFSLSIKVHQVYCQKKNPEIYRFSSNFWDLNLGHGKIHPSSPPQSGWRLPTFSGKRRVMTSVIWRYEKLHRALKKSHESECLGWVVGWLGLVGWVGWMTIDILFFEGVNRLFPSKRSRKYGNLGSGGKAFSRFFQISDISWA